LAPSSFWSASDREVSWPLPPLTVNTAYGEPSLTVTLLTVRTRSSSAMALVSVVPSALKISPVPSSLMVAVPLTEEPHYGKQLRLKNTIFYLIK
jgi:hypothetical protein